MTAHAAWLAALARRLLHRDTFETMVSPAIADLDAERASGWRTYSRHCRGLTVVLGVAMLRDWRTDVREAFDFGARRDVWLVTAIWYTAPTVLLAGLLLKSQTPWHLLDATAVAAVVLDTTLGARLYASYVAVTAAVFFLSRRLPPIKALVIGVAVVSFAFAAMNATSSAIRVPLNRTIYETASRRLATAPLPSGERSWERADGRTWVEWRGRQAARSTSATELVGWFAIAPLGALFNFLPFGLVGLALARGRGASVALRAAAVVGTIVTIHLLTIKWDEPNEFLQFLRQMGAVTAGALFWIAVGPVVRLMAAPFRTVSDWRPGTRPV
jgi:hypothetical protein